MKTISYKLLIVTAFILTIATVANAQVTKEEQSALTPDKVLTDLMAGNARFAAGNIGDLESRCSITGDSSSRSLDHVGLRSNIKPSGDCTKFT